MIVLIKNFIFLYKTKLIMGNNNLNLILRLALKLFLTNHYEKVLHPTWSFS